MAELVFPVDENAHLLQDIRPELEVVQTNQLYGIWVRANPEKNQKGGWLNNSGHVATWSPKQNALDFIHGMGSQYEVRPIFLVTTKLDATEKD
jgi:hypothetical protein